MNLLAQGVFLVFQEPGELIAWVYRAFGAKVGKDSRLLLFMACPDHDLVDVGDNCVITGGHFCHNFGGGRCGDTFSICGPLPAQSPMYRRG